MSDPKYSIRENERRFLIKKLPDGFFDSRAFNRIEDKYLSCGRIRIRKWENSISGSVVYKLCKKYEHEDNYSKPITNIYLSESEYRDFLKLEGKVLCKKRYIDKIGNLTFGIDVFKDQLEGLLLCEIESNDKKSLLEIVAPKYTLCDVTEDPFFTGGNLVNVTKDHLSKKLFSF